MNAIEALGGLDFSLPVIWALLIGTAVALYIVLDGFDLGIGILFPFFKEERERDQMMNSVAPFWDGNETWLVLGGGGLWVAFPLAYAVIMPAVYLPIITMLLALIFRGVAFEFRWVAKPHHRKWDIAFSAGSIVAAFSQGMVLGALLQGIRVENNQFAGGTFDWLSSFSLMTGVAVVFGYALIGAGWLVMKTDGSVEARARRLGRPLVLLVAAFIAAVSIWTPLAFPRIAARWFDWPEVLYLAPLPIATVLVLATAWRSFHRAHVLPFLCAVGAFLLAYAGLVISNVPYLVPPTIDIWRAAAAPSSQMFLLLGTLILLPMILGYTAFLYWVFRGKVRADAGYH
jgi:cytochrome d ubiquinol oxidase subunit II